jgi:hypothetical protein
MKAVPYNGYHGRNFQTERRVSQIFWQVFWIDFKFPGVEHWKLETLPKVPITPLHTPGDHLRFMIFPFGVLPAG